MELDPYVDRIRDQVSQAAESSGESARELADRLTVVLDASVRLALLEALSTAAAEVTQELAPGSVEVRLRGRDPEFVVTPPPSLADVTPVATSVDLGPIDTDDAELVRINLRLPHDLKERVEQAARGAGLSVNAWLVRAAGGALAPSSSTNSASPASGARHQRYSGWVR
jgi:hypothetical protein